MQQHEDVYDYAARCGKAPFAVSGNTGTGIAATISVLLHATVILLLSLAASSLPSLRVISIFFEHLPQARDLSSAQVFSFPPALGTIRANGDATTTRIRKSTWVHPPASLAESSRPSDRKNAFALRARKIENRKLERELESIPQNSTIEPGVAQRIQLSGDPGRTGFAEDRKGEPLGRSVTRSTDLHGNPGEEVEYVSLPDSSVKVTIREAYGYAGMHQSASSGISDEDPPGFNRVSDDSALARSQRFDWKILDDKNLSITAFGYQNEIGKEFRPFGKFKKEFAKADTSTTKAGAKVRLGPLGVGFTQSATGNAEPSIEYGDNLPRLAATQQDVNVTLDLPKLLSNIEELSGISSELIPNLWVSQSDTHPASKLRSADLETVSTSFGGSWSWDSNQATLGYWNYSSDRPAGRAGSAWNGEGFDATLGLYYSSFGLDLNLSYGHMEDVAGSWQSASTLYDSSITLSYSGESLPPIWATAAAGNFHSSSLLGTALPSAGTLTDLEEATRNEYWSFETGVDLSGLFWNPETSYFNELAKQHSSIKLIFQYTDNLYLDSEGPMRSADGLVAMLVQSTF
jgi:hypothetical protein